MKISPVLFKVYQFLIYFVSAVNELDVLERFFHDEFLLRTNT